jgi:hypothetical protein
MCTSDLVATHPLGPTVDAVRDKHQIIRDMTVAQPLYKRRFDFDSHQYNIIPSEVVSGRLWMGGFLDADTMDTICIGSGPLFHDVGILQMAEPPIEGYSDERCWADDDRVRTLHVALMDDTIDQVVDPVVLATKIEDLMTDHARVYVHCAMGVSRSSTAVLAWLMRFRGLSYHDSLCFLQMRRPCVCPNATFTTALLEYEATLLQSSEYKCNMD